MRKYEVMIIIDPTVEERQVDSSWRSTEGHH